MLLSASMKFLILLSTFLSLALADDLADCRCMDGWKPEQDENGNVNCHGVVLKSILPCNLILKPNCVCSEDSTSVVQDATGTFCVKMTDGAEEKRWDCENKNDWQEFYKIHPEEKPQPSNPQQSDKKEN